MRAPLFWYRNKKNYFIYLLWPFQIFYRIVFGIRSLFLKPKSVRSFVICVGNITVGGSGKTPSCIALYHMLKSLGKICFLNSGYSGKVQNELVIDGSFKESKKNYSDETRILSQYAPVAINKNRYLGASLVKNDTSIFIMDDGLQNFSLQKDLSLLLIDQDSFGNGHVLPMGPLREMLTSALKRIDAIIYIGKKDPSLMVNDNITQFTALRIIRKDSIDQLTGKRVYGFAGIANPKNFIQSLKTIGCEVENFQVFNDHEDYTDEQIKTLIKKSRDKKNILVTTEKDYIKINNKYKKYIHCVYMDIVFDNPDKIYKFIKEKINLKISC